MTVDDVKIQLEYSLRSNGAIHSWCERISGDGKRMILPNGRIWNINKDLLIAYSATLMEIE